MVMKLFNKGERAFIIRSKDIISGDGRVNKILPDKGYINPQSIVEVEDKVGDELLASYPKELFRLDEPKKKE